MLFRSAEFIKSQKQFDIVVFGPGVTTVPHQINEYVEISNYFEQIDIYKKIITEQEKETGRYIRKERYAGACSRSFYVGKEVEKEDIKAEFKHGILTLFVPKKEAKPAVEQKKTIAIEG